MITLAGFQVCITIIRNLKQQIFPEGETSKLSESNEAIKEIKSHGFFKVSITFNFTPSQTDISKNLKISFSEYRLDGSGREEIKASIQCQDFGWC